MRAALHILFIGNSLTARNDLSSMVRILIPTSEVYTLTVPGASLNVHTSNSATRSLIREGKWTHVVLQEQSDKLSFADRGFERIHVWPAAKLLASDVASINATLVWYETPAHVGGNYVGDSFRAMQGRVAAGYASLNAAVGYGNSKIAPVGRAFGMASNATRPKLFTDSVHPSKAGSYLAALVFYRTITGGPAQKTKWAPRGLSKSLITNTRRWADGVFGYPQVKN